MNAAVNPTADEPEEIEGENEIIIAERYRILPPTSISVSIRESRLTTVISGKLSSSIWVSDQRM